MLSRTFSTMIGTFRVLFVGLINAISPENSMKPYVINLFYLINTEHIEIGHKNGKAKPCGFSLPCGPGSTYISHL